MSSGIVRRRDWTLKRHLPVCAAILLVACQKAAPEKIAADIPPATAAPSALAPEETPNGLSESFEAPSAPFDDYPGEVLTCTGPVSRPVRTIGPLPIFPPKREGLRFPGVVEVEGIIDKAGSVPRLRITKSFDPDFDSSVLSTVRTWKFEPARLGGKPVDVYYQLKVNFVLEKTPGAQAFNGVRQ